MSDLPEYPLVTFALFAYNHEQYIREAVEGALAQDYPNLEIIISDDCSQDGTWSVIERVVINYAGPHQIVLNRNSKNLGIGRHVGAIGTLAKGTLIVLAAGDDISSGHRTSALVDAWLSAGKPISALHSIAMEIDKSGMPSGRLAKGRAADPAKATLDAFCKAGFTARIHGATAAYTRQQFDMFSPLNGNIEDIPLTFRTLLLGELIFVEMPLINYRVFDGNFSRKLVRSDRMNIARMVESLLLTANSLLDDYENYCKMTSNDIDIYLINHIKNIKRKYRAALGMASSNFVKNIWGLMNFPIDGTLRDRLWLIAVYFGFKK